MNSPAGAQSTNQGYEGTKDDAIQSNPHKQEVTGQFNQILKKKEVGRSYFGLNRSEIANDELESSGTSQSLS